MDYVEQRFVLDLTTFTRHSVLPEDAIGDVRVNMGDRVDIKQVVAHGTIPARYVIVEAAQQLRLKDPAELENYVTVDLRNAVDVGRTLAQHGRRVVSAPVTGLVSYIGQGRIILQETPELVEQEAGVNGRVIKVIPGRGVVVEATGTLIQGVWGNGKNRLGPLRVEPTIGLENITEDTLDIQYRGAVVVTRQPLRASGLAVMQEVAFAGIVAPSMDADLREQARQMDAAIMLTEGFGSARMNSTIFALLAALVNKQVTLDAAMGDRFSTQRPELVVNIAVRAGERPPAPQPTPLKVGANVLVTRDPHAGVGGRVVDLPKPPQLIDNGLRVFCAVVELNTGGTVNIPLANLEVYGK